MGARLKPNEDGLDVDIFDDFCEHLIVRDTETLKVIGTYRVLPPHQAKQMGCFYSDSEFDLTRLRHLRHKMVEVGRSCVHQDYRSGGVIMALWSGLGQYMKKHDYEIMLGCASVQMGDGGHYAASLSKMLNANHLTDMLLGVVENVNCVFYDNLLDAINHQDKIKNAKEVLSTISQDEAIRHLIMSDPDIISKIKS